MIISMYFVLLLLLGIEPFKTVFYCWGTESFKTVFYWLGIESFKTVFYCWRVEILLSFTCLFWSNFQRLRSLGEPGLSGEKMRVF